MEDLVQSTAKSLSKAFEVPEEFQNKIMEGFEPHTVAEEISIDHLASIFKTILSEYPPPQKFSDALANNFKSYIRELISEVSEGLYGGTDDFQIILKTYLQKELSNMAGNSLEGMEGMMMAFLWPQLWQKILRMCRGDEEV